LEQHGFDGIDYHPRRAKSYAEDGIGYLKSALTDLNDAASELKDCD
jgi:hypothetical protein